MLTGESIYEIFAETGVLQTGHFELSSGRHANKYLQCARVLQYPEFANELAEGIADFWEGNEIDLVVGPAMGGIVISHAVGQALGVRSIFSERKKGDMQLRRGFQINPGERVLVVEDVVTTGGSVREVLELLEKKDCEIVGISSLVDRSGGRVKFDYQFKPLLQIEVASYLPENCVLCQENVPLTKPGSKKK